MYAERNQKGVLRARGYVTLGNLHMHCLTTVVYCFPVVIYFCNPEPMDTLSSQAVAEYHVRAKRSS